MNFIKEIFAVIKNIFLGLKNILGMIKRREWISAIKETGHLFKSVYTDHLKGKYLEVNGKKIPMTIVVVLVVALLYLIIPSGSNDEVVAPKEPQKTVEINTYDQDGLKIYNMHACEEAACGTLENAGQLTFEEIGIEVTFYADDGIAVCKGQVTANNVVPATKSDFSVPCEIDFTSFKLVKVEPKIMEE